MHASNYRLNAGKIPGTLQRSLLQLSGKDKGGCINCDGVK